MSGKTLKILFTSDLHSYFYPTDYRSPGSRDVGLFKCANRFQKDGNTLLIDGGDNLQGSPFGAFCHDSLGSAETAAQIMNGCGYDYVTIGNHDFNYGKSYLRSYLDNLAAKCVCQNVLFDGECPFPPQIHTLENGLRVGIVGIVTDYVNIWEKPDNLKTITVADPFPAAATALEALKDQVDITVCVYHGGFEEDLATGKVLLKTSENIGCRICRELDFDVLLTGHQHMSVDGQMLYGTYVVQPLDAGKEFHEITITLDESGKHISSKKIPAGGICDAKMLDRFAPVERGADAWLDAVVGHLEQPLVPGDRLDMALHGSSLVDFFQTVQIAASGAQISVTSLANEIAGIPQIVRRRDVLAAYPYANTLAVLEVTGEILRKAVERSAEYFSRNSRGELAVSGKFLIPKIEHYNYDHYMGVDIVLDVDRPEGSRVVSLKYQGREVLDSDRFTLCLNNYRASGAGGYEFYRDCPVRREINTEMADLILEYFHDHPRPEIRPGSSLQIL